MDTRTERKLRLADTTPDQATITNPFGEQWRALCRWIDFNKGKSGPKFIACGSPLGVPLKRTIEHPALWRNDDGWLGFPGALAKLVELIADHDIKNVIFLGGDYHLSAYATMNFFANGKRATVHQIIASGLYAPLPFANVKPNQLGHGRYRIPGSEHQIEFCEPKILCTSQSHFLRVEVLNSSTKSTWEILILPYDDKNNCQLNAPKRILLI